MPDIKVVRRLVQQQHLRPLCQGTRDMYALLFTARQRMPVPVAKARQVHIRQGLRHDGIILMAPPAQGRQPRCAAQFNGMAHGDTVSRVGVLFDQRQPLRNVALAHLCKRCAVQFDPPARRFLNTGKHMQQRGFTRSVRPDQPQLFARSQGQGHIVDNGAVAHPPAQFVTRQDHGDVLLPIRISANTGAPTKAVTTPMGSTWPGTITREITSAKTKNTAPASADAGTRIA